MKKVFSRLLPAATLVAWGVILIHFFFSGRIAALLHPMFRPFVLISGIILVLLAVGLLFAPDDAALCCDDDGCGHLIGRITAGRITTFLILLLPICAASAFSSDGFSASTILNRGVISDASGLKPTASPTVQQILEPPMPANGAMLSTPPSPQPGVQSKDPARTQQAAVSAADEYLPKSKTGNIMVQVTDLLYAAEDSSLRGDFSGKKIEMIGQLMPDNVNNATGNRFKLVRMLMVCCAADARPVAVLVDSGHDPKIPEMSWVRVTGFATFPIEGGRTIALVRADSVAVTDPPEETMLY